MGGGRGNAMSGVMFHHPTVPGAALIAKFGLEALGGGRRPDDAAPARMDRFASVPGGIVLILHRLIGGGEVCEIASMIIASQR
jgi:hypothetical protein